jgi:hypothetical protein
LAVAQGFSAFLQDEQLGTPLDQTDAGQMDPTSSLYTGGVGLRQWYYQTCTETGDWEVIPADPTQTLNPVSIRDLYAAEPECMKVLGVHFTADPANGIDARYLTPLIAADSQTTNVFITNDENDPTHGISITAEQNQNPGVTVYSVAGAAHHEELGTPKPTDSQALIDARAAILKAIGSWLK